MEYKKISMLILKFNVFLKEFTNSSYSMLLNRAKLLLNTHI